MDDGETSINPYLPRNQVAVSVVLPCSGPEAWDLIGTADGYTRWFPVRCEGSFEVGGTVDKSWWWDDQEPSNHTIVGMQHADHIEYSWEVVDGATVRYQIEHDGPTVVTIRATYPESDEGRAAQLLDVAPWTFAALNLKSVASGGVDLRHRGPKPAIGAPFID